LATAGLAQEAHSSLWQQLLGQLYEGGGASSSPGLWRDETGSCEASPSPARVAQLLEAHLDAMEGLGRRERSAAPAAYPTAAPRTAQAESDARQPKPGAPAARLAAEGNIQVALRSLQVLLQSGLPPL